MSKPTKPSLKRARRKAQIKRKKTQRKAAPRIKSSKKK
jgi:hypothetical protein